jgi:hypothetical protein
LIFESLILSVKLYGTGNWALSRHYEVAYIIFPELNFYRRAARKSRKRKISYLKIIQIKEVKEEKLLKWFLYVKRTRDNRITNIKLKWDAENRRKKGKPG